MEPDALVFSALLVEEQGNQSYIEDEADSPAPKDATRDVVIDADRRAESKRRQRAARTKDVQDERRKACGYGKPPAEAQVIGHQETTECVHRNDDENDHDTEAVTADEIALDTCAIDDGKKREYPIEIEQPCGDLQRLWLHPIEPFAKVDVHRCQVWQK
ncbi:MAG: hypothetical protein RLZZ48_683 [Actinomycetota bacterium]